MQIRALAGGPANLEHVNSTQLGFAGAQAMVSDQANGYYIAATNANVVYHVTASGAVSIVAGTGVASNTGGGGPATSAALSAPNALALDSAGELYVGDAYGVRKVNTAGSLVNLFLYGPVVAIVIDSQDNVYLAVNSVFGQILQLLPAGCTVMIVGTNPTGTCSGSSNSGVQANISPTGLAKFGNVFYFSESEANEVESFNPSTGTIQDVAGVANSQSGGFSGDGGPATQAQLNFPTAVAADPQGDIFFADANNYRIRMVSASTGIIQTLAGNGDPGFSGDGAATSVSVDDSSSSGILAASATQFVFLDSANERIRHVISGKIETVAGAGNGNYNGDGFASTAAALDQPFALAKDSKGNVYISEIGGSRVRKIDAVTGIISTYAGSALGAGSGSSGDGGPASAAELCPGALAFDNSDNLYVVDFCALLPSIRKIDASTGTISTIATGIDLPIALAVWDNSLFVADYGCDVLSYSLTANPPVPASVYAGGGGCGYSGDGVATAESLNDPAGIAFDSSGTLYIADENNYLVREVTTSGRLITIGGLYGGGFFGIPASGKAALATYAGIPSSIGASDGTVYVGTVVGQEIYGINLSSGILTTLAGNPTGTSTGTSTYTLPAPALGFPFTNPVAVLPDGFGSFYVADEANNAVTVVSSQPAPSGLKLTTSATSINSGSSATLTATIGAPQFGRYATGKVTFSADGYSIGSASLNSGTAVLSPSTAGVPTGTYPVIATYGGDANYAGSVSNTVTENVGYDTTTTLTATPSSVVKGSTVKLVATIKNSAGVTVTAGSVAFYAAGVLLDTVSSANGQFTLSGSTAPYPKGTYSLNAVYSGSLPDFGSTSTAVTVTIQ